MLQRSWTTRCFVSSRQHFHTENPQVKEFPRQTSALTKQNPQQTSSYRACIYCDGGHPLHNCDQFKKIFLNVRRTLWPVISYTSIVSPFYMYHINVTRTASIRLLTAIRYTGTCCMMTRSQRQLITSMPTPLHRLKQFKRVLHWVEAQVHALICR